MSLNTSKKIDKLKIENFQSWKNVEIDFDTFNVIEGKSSSGKTAILRAISMVLNNDWDTSWLRKGESKARVTLFYDDGTALIRCRGSENSVSLVQDGRVIDKWVKDISNSYPPEVRDIINVEDYNFSGQFDGHFFIGLSPNKRAEALGEFSDLSKIDQLIGLNQKNIRQCNSSNKFLSESFENLSLDKEKVEKIKKGLPTSSEIKDIVNLLKETVQLTNHLEKMFTLKKTDDELKSVEVLDECLDLYIETKKLFSHLEFMKVNEEINLLLLEKKELIGSIEGSFCPICKNIIEYS